jgi:RHS repeat-associated protein
LAKVLIAENHINNEFAFVYNAAGQLTAEYQTNYQASNTRTSYLTADHLGSPRVTTDSAGVVKSRHDYYAFGEEISSGITGRLSTQKYVDDSIRQQYTGYERDDESGLDYAQARYYSSQHGRFTSVDPLMASATIKNPQTFNRYSYALNSPYKFTDPLGLAATNPQCGNGGRCDTQADDLDKERARTERRQATQEEFNRAMIRYLFDRASQGYVGDTWGQLFTATVTTVETTPPSFTLVDFRVRDDSNDGATSAFPFMNWRVADDFDDALQEINELGAGPIGFTEMFRPTSHQEKLYNDYQKKLQKYNSLPWWKKLFSSPPTPAHPPGTSAHEAGFAFDINLDKYSAGQLQTIIAVFTNTFATRFSDIDGFL